MTAVTAPADATVPAVLHVSRHPTLQILRASCRFARTRVGLAIVGALVLFAVLGPRLSPHTPTEFVGKPNAGRSATALFGTDQLGRDVWSRVMHGGGTVIWLAAIATAMSIVAGATLGLVAAYHKGWRDNLIMRSMDVVLAFPPIILALLAVSAIGPKLWLVVLAVSLTNAPGTARVIYGAASEVFERDFIKAAEAAGERPSRIIFSEGLSNVTGPLMAETGLRMTYSIAIIAALSFLGFGLQAPRADWGLMINENRVSMAVQPWSVLVPAAFIGLLTVGFNLVTDGVARVAAGIDRGGRS